MCLMCCKAFTWSHSIGKSRFVFLIFVSEVSPLRTPTHCYTEIQDFLGSSIYTFVDWVLFSLCLESQKNRSQNLLITIVITVSVLVNSLELFYVRPRRIPGTRVYATIYSPTRNITHASLEKLAEQNRLSRSTNPISITYAPISLTTRDALD